MSKKGPIPESTAKSLSERTMVFAVPSSAPMPISTERKTSSPIPFDPNYVRHRHLASSLPVTASEFGDADDDADDVMFACSVMPTTSSLMPTKAKPPKTLADSGDLFLDDEPAAALVFALNNLRFSTDSKNSLLPDEEDLLAIFGTSPPEKKRYDNKRY